MQTPPGSQDLHEEALGLEEGLERALSLPPNGFLAVEDPPGTGKTSVIAAAACEIATAGGKVLTTSLTNVAVDNAIERILAENLRSGNTSPRTGHPAKMNHGRGSSRRSMLRRQRAISSTVRGAP